MARIKSYPITIVQPLKRKRYAGRASELPLKKLKRDLEANIAEKERLKPCSGRDEMCHSVLNDDWASHPTWASEDSGFVAHRKNQFEEGLHRIEEERHDYDFNIEANAKVIQLLEPIGQSLLSMDPIERENFRMPLGLGGQSQAIYKRVLKKIYGDKGPEVAADLFRDPGAVLPVVLARLKQKDEEWRFTQVSLPPCSLIP
jgi:paired amphipathic helix protein Sin3a